LNDESCYTAYYPKLVTAAHRLTAALDAPWGPRSRSMMRLVVAGVRAARAQLGQLQMLNPALWAELDTTDCVRLAIDAALPAMIMAALDELAMDA
jgi:hypothetical protein